MKWLKKFNEEVTDDNLFTMDEITHLVNEAEKIGFHPQKYSVSDKSFDVNKAKYDITFVHNKTDNNIKLEKWNIKSLGLDIMTDSIADILFSVLWNDLDNESYVRNYDPS